MAASIMIQGTASDAGKSVITAALCRCLFEDGYKVAPFKSQNMSSNSYLTEAGKEIAAVQAVQAEAAAVEPEVNMSPILMKPTADNLSQIILQGEFYKELNAANYYGEKKKFIEIIKKALTDLKDKYEVLVLEGGGNPAEVNLKDKDFVNMKVAELAEAPVILAADIDKGGVFASIVGTLDLLSAAERKRVKGIIINKFRGDPANFEDGVKLIEKITKKKVLGVLPYLDDLNLPAEDSLNLSTDNKAKFKLDSVFDRKIAAEKLNDYKSAAEYREDNYIYLAKKFRKYIDLELLYKIIFKK